MTLAFEANFTRFSNLARDAYMPDRIDEFAVMSAPARPEGLSGRLTVDLGAIVTQLAGAGPR